MHKIVRWSRLAQLLLLISFPVICSGQGRAQQWSQGTRDQRSLANTFPFSLTQEFEPNSFQDLDSPAFSRQTSSDDISVDFNSVASAGAGADGKRCIDKVEMVEETEYDDVYECNHSYNRRCHTSYSTTYSAQQEEECEDNYKKSCFIQYSPTAFNTTVTICRGTLVKDCNQAGPDTCSTEYISECETTQEPHQVEDDVAECRTEVEEKCEDVVSGYTTSQKCSNWPTEKCDVVKKSVTKFTPITKCNKVPVEICGPSSCPLVAGPEECFEKTKTITSEKPEEECSLEPRVECKHVTKLVPKLEPKEACVDVPKEVCTRSQSNPRKVKKPIVKKWCYVPKGDAPPPPPPPPRPVTTPRPRPPPPPPRPVPTTSRPRPPPPPPVTTTTRRPIVTTTRPALNPGFGIDHGNQNAGAHQPAATPPDNSYLPPGPEPLPGYGGAKQGRQGFSLPRRGSRQFVPNFNTASSGSGKAQKSTSLASRARSEKSPKFNNWDLFLKSGLIKRRG